MNTPSPPESRPRVLALVRAALLIGVLVFGVIAWVLAGSDGMAVLDAGTLEQFRLILAMVLVGVSVGVLLMRRRRQQRTSFQGKAIFSLIGWAAAEAAALVGGTYFMITGDPFYYLLGLALVLVTGFVVMPLPPREE